MLQQQKQIKFSNYSELYDLLVPQDHLLRSIAELVDFSFVYDELKDKYCSYNGRMAEDPIRMFKYLLLKTIYSISDVDVVKRTLTDLSFKYFLGLCPEETNLIDPSLLSKFRRQRLKDTKIMDMLIKKTVCIALEKGIIQSKRFFVDATHSLSRSNSVNATDYLIYQMEQTTRIVHSINESFRLPELPDLHGLSEKKKFPVVLSTAVDYVAAVEAAPPLVAMPAVSERLNLLKEIIADAKIRYVTSKDPDARIGHKTKSRSFFGYKTHLVMSEERIIVAADVTSGEADDGKMLERLVEKTEENGVEIDTIIGDTAYSSKANLDMINDKNENENKDIKLCSPLNPVISNGTRKGATFDYNKDAGMFVCPAGHMAVSRSKPQQKTNVPGKYHNPVIVFSFDVERCKVCPLREGCYKPGAKKKTYSVRVLANTHKKQMEYEKTSEFVYLQRKRYMIEAKNAELKNVFGYDRAMSYGLASMELQGAMAIFAANLKRIIRIM